jgi:hypothetical protein
MEQGSAEGMTDAPIKTTASDSDRANRERLLLVTSSDRV